MTIEEYARQIVAAWPPLTARQIERIRARLQPAADQLRLARQHTQRRAS